MAGIKFMRLSWAAVSASVTKIISSSRRSLNSVFGCSASSFHDKLCVIRNVFLQITFCATSSSSSDEGPP